jgi:tetratricopeptide (TPR) repeat protein
MRCRTLQVLTVMAALGCGTASAFSPDDARASYRENFAESFGPVETDGTNLFLIVDEEVPDGLPGGANQVVLTGMHQALLDWIDGSESNVPPSPFCPRLTEFVLPDVPFDLPEIDGVVVEHVVKDGCIRHAMALELAPFEAVKADVAAKKNAPRPLDSWLECLSGSRADLRSDKERDLFLSLLGCPEALVSAQPAARCFENHADLVAISEALASWNPSKPTSAGCRDVLEVVPSFAPAWLARAGMEERSKHWAAAIACLAAAQAAAPAPLDIAGICTAAKGEQGSPAWDEYAELLPRLSGLKPDAPIRATPFWKYVFQTAGHIDFSPSGRLDGGAYREAIELWCTGEKSALPQILSLLQDSIEATPENPDAWKYLAAGLRFSDLPEMALIAYNVAARLAPDDAEIPAYQAMLYQTLGYPALASGSAWRALLADGLPEKVADRAKRVIFETRPEAFAPEAGP